MSTSETKPKSEPVAVEERRVWSLPRISRRFVVAGLLVAVAVNAGVVVLAALTSWWVLFALFGSLPLLMMGGCLAMMGAIGGRVGSGFCAEWMGSGFCASAPCASLWARKSAPPPRETDTESAVGSPQATIV